MKANSSNRKRPTKRNPHEQATNKQESRKVRRRETRSSTSASSSSLTEDVSISSRRKQKQPVRKQQYTDMMIGNKFFKLSMKIYREIRELQSSTNFVIPRAAFARVVREILGEHGHDWRVQTLTLQALQDATEIFMHQYFEDSNLCSMHSRRVTLMPKDMTLVKQLRENNSSKI